MPAQDPDTIGVYEYIRYERPEESFRPYDPRVVAVAARVAAMITARVPRVCVEHVGSTAVPGCDGKGVVDLMVLYQPGGLVAAREAVDSLGFQRQTNRDPFPEERPLRVGAIQHDGESFRLHIHVIAADSPEAEEQIRFRDALQADAGLVAEYVALKRTVLAGGVVDSGEYNLGKEPLIHRILGRANRT